MKRTQDTCKTKSNETFGMYIVPGIIIIILIIIASYVVPIKISDSKCYQEVAQDECGVRVLIFQNDDIDVAVVDRDLNFECCDYSVVKEDSRRVFDSMPYCEYYNFIEVDHLKCSKRYHHWGAERWTKLKAYLWI